MRSWTTQDSDEIYNVSRWGKEFFSIADNGNILVSPTGNENHSIDIKDLVEDLKGRGIGLPVLLRFSDILGTRMGQIHEAFKSAAKEYNYKGKYHVVVPIKVNQQKHVLEDIITQGQPYHVGLEAGSKPELLAAIGMVSDPESIIICNGYKDFEYLETALLSCKLGLQTIVICDRFREMKDLVHLKEKRGLIGPIGMRCKLATKGAGRWAESVGESSKFGLSASEMVQAVKLLEKAQMLDQLRCLHFHIGSQVTAIRAITAAIKEAARIFVDLSKMGAKLQYIDIGGGLAVDYDGSKTNFASSMNYTLEEYASNIVAEICDACDAAKLEHPTILSESGRALLAHHSVLVFDVLDTNELPEVSSVKKPKANAHEHLQTLYTLYKETNQKNLQESYHDAIDAREQMLNLFSLGYVVLEERAKAEELFWALAHKIYKLSQSLDYVPEDLKLLEKRLVDTYYCNFSLFQSLPDYWAVDSLFPIIPLQNLHIKPSRKGVLADLTCDSDGKISRFIDLHDIKKSLPLHPFDGTPYYIGIFLVGAYQETLGDLHNLFGDTDAVHVALDKKEGYQIHHHVIGDSVADVLGYMEYDAKDLVRRVRMATESALKSGRMSFEEVRLLMRRYETGLMGYTYLEGEDQMIETL